MTRWSRCQLQSANETNYFLFGRWIQIQIIMHSTGHHSTTHATATSIACENVTIVEQS